MTSISFQHIKCNLTLHEHYSSLIIWSVKTAYHEIICLRIVQYNSESIMMNVLSTLVGLFTFYFQCEYTGEKGMPILCMNIRKRGISEVKKKTFYFEHMRTLK